MPAAPTSHLIELPGMLNVLEAAEHPHGTAPKFGPGTAMQCLYHFGTLLSMRTPF